MDFTLPDELKMLQDTVRKFVDKELRPLEPQLLAARGAGLTPETRAHLKSLAIKAGLWGMTGPEEFGGGGLGALGACLVEEELGKTFIPFDFDVSPLLFECNAEQKARYLLPVVNGEKEYALAIREMEAGLDAAAFITRAVPHGEGYRLDGRKRCAPDADAADFYLVFAQTEPGLTCFLIERETPGLTLKSVPGEVEMVLTECVVPASQVLGTIGSASKLGQRWAPLQHLKESARQVGVTGRLLEMAATYAKDWTVFDRPLLERPATTRLIAEMSLDRHAARLMVQHAAWKLDAGLAAPIELAQVRVFVTEMVQRAIDKTVQIYGGPAYVESLPMLRDYASRIAPQAVEAMLNKNRAAIVVGLVG